MAKNPIGEAGSGDSPSRRDETTMGYFRRLLADDPHLLRERSNRKIIERWLQDHPEFSEMPGNVKNILNNLKSHLRKKLRSERREREAGWTPLANANPRETARAWDRLEVLLDECLALARTLDGDRLKGVVTLLRRARNEVVRNSDR